MLLDRRKSEAIAQEILSMKYEKDGRGMDGKVDCYGVLVHYYKQFGLNLPDYSSRKDWGDNEEIILSEYAKFFRKLAPDEKPKTGDMIILKNIEGEEGHLALYLGEGKFIHSYKKIGSKIDSLAMAPWKNKIYGFFRISGTE